MSQLLQGRYRREAVLGEWDAATTTLALDTLTQQLCVVKALRLPRDAASDLAKLLKREARAYQQLAHPRIPRLLDSFAKDEGGLTSFYLVQEHVAGRDLSRVVREDGPYSEPQALALLRGLLELLDRFHGHEPPLTHRAVKPQNVVIAESGAAHLIDFGSWSGAMRRLLGPEGQIAPSDTRGFGAPEQLSGRPVAASDVFSLGATLVFALSGSDPAELADTPYAAVSKLRVSRRLRRVLHGMLEPDVDARFTNARQALLALQPPPSPALATSRAFAGGAAALALAGFVFIARQPSPPAPRAVEAPAAVAAQQPPQPQLPKQPPPREMPARALEQVRDPSPPPTVATPVPQKLTAPRPVPVEDALPAVQPHAGVLSLNVYRDFKYVAGGWPGGLSVGQTDASALDTSPQEALRAEPRYASAHPLYGYLTLGNGPDPRISFVLDELERPTWVLWVDKNNNQDLTDDGAPQRNEGTGFMAATLRLFVDFGSDAGVVRRPYQLWLWVNDWKNAPPARPPYVARFYATCHYAGRVALEGETFEAAAFEQRGHDGLLDEDGVWIDLDRDGKFNPPREHFVDGEEVRTGRAVVRIRLASR